MGRRELTEIEDAEAEAAERRFVAEAMEYNESRRRRRVVVSGESTGDGSLVDER